MVLTALWPAPNCKTKMGPNLVICRRRTESFNQKSVQQGSQEWKELSAKLKERLNSADAVLAQDTYALSTF